MFAQQLHSAKDRLKVSYKGWLGWVCFGLGGMKRINYSLLEKIKDGLG